MSQKNPVIRRNGQLDEFVLHVSGAV
jgi:hypothetical protein